MAGAFLVRPVSVAATLTLIPLACWVIYNFANRMVFAPTPYPDGAWDRQREFGAVDVWLESGDHVKLHAWWVEVPGARIATLYLHGNGGNLAYRVGHLHEVPKAGSSFLILDYRGYGRSVGTPSERGFYQDADAGYDWLLARGFRPNQIVAHGESLGTAVAVDLAVRRHCAGVILESPFTSVTEMAGRVVPFFGPLVVWGFDSLAKIPRLRVPLLIIHGDRDEVVPIAMGERLFAAAHPPKSFWRVSGAGHIDIVTKAGQQFGDRLQAFYATLSSR